MQDSESTEYCRKPKRSRRRCSMSFSVSLSVPRVHQRDSVSTLTASTLQRESAKVSSLVFCSSSCARTMQSSPSATPTVSRPKNVLTSRSRPNTRTPCCSALCEYRATKAVCSARVSGELTTTPAAANRRTLSLSVALVQALCRSSACCTPVAFNGWSLLPTMAARSFSCTASFHSLCAPGDAQGVTRCVKEERELRIADLSWLSYFSVANEKQRAAHRRQAARYTAQRDCPAFSATLRVQGKVQRSLLQLAYSNLCRAKQIIAVEHVAVIHLHLQAQVVSSVFLHVQKGVPDRVHSLWTGARLLWLAPRLSIAADKLQNGVAEFSVMSPNGSLLARTTSTMRPASEKTALSLFLRKQESI
eukprot:m.56844 g.56844  ORF g.56844 m.56844 type:complete len:361 (-) comp15748_c0_seq4:9-1091(-)